MSAIRINRRSNNLEILSKLLDSVATKYDCRVKYNPSSRQVQFIGEDACKSHIVEETLHLVKVRQ